MDKHLCQVCGSNIIIMIRKNTGLCCENCEKVVREKRNEAAKVSGTSRNRVSRTANKTRTRGQSNSKS
jgi:hypothetical protein